MANLKKIKNKIKSVQNLKKITRALEIVSTVKLQKSKDKADTLKKYLFDLLYILQNIGSKVDLFNDTNKKSDKNLVIVVTSDRGLCWSLNSKLTRAVFNDFKDQKSNTDFFVIWKKWLDVLSRSGFNLVWICQAKDEMKDDDLLPLFEYLNSSFSQNTYWSIKIYFNYFKNSLIQIPSQLQVYPLTKTHFEDFLSSVGISYDLNSVHHTWKDLVIEPSREILLEEIKRQIRNYLILSALVQNKAWEHASRMIAMKNAKDNSTKLINHLVLWYNKVRQSSITQEISEIVSAKIAIEG